VGSEGLVLTVSYPEQVYSPIAYNSFRVGGMSLSVIIPPGEKVRPYFDTLHAELEAMVDEQFDRVSEHYAARLGALKGKR
jgi:hypothetical protein